MAEKLRRLEREYRANADAIKRTLDLVNGHDTERKRDQHDQLFEAVQLDAARRKGRPPGRPRLKPGPKPKTKGHAKKVAASSRGSKSQRQQREEQGVKFLALFDADEPRASKGPRTTPFINHGYLRKQGEGYVRTAKPYPAPKE